MRPSTIKRSPCTMESFWSIVTRVPCLMRMEDMLETARQLEHSQYHLAVADGSRHRQTPVGAESDPSTTARWYRLRFQSKDTHHRGTENTKVAQRKAKRITTRADYSLWKAVV